MFRRNVVASAIAMAAVAALGCGDSSTEPELDPYPPAADDTLPYVYEVPEARADGWQVAAASEVGFSEARLTDLVDIIREGVYANVHGVVIVKDDRLVLEEYFSGLTFRGAIGDSIIGDWRHFDHDDVHNLASVTKSITSTLVGIAIDQGLITGVDTAVYDFFPEHESLRDARKDSITLHHLLTMTSGLDWDESTCSYGTSCNDINALFSQTDPIGYILAKEAIDVPGSTWVYNGGGTNVLGQVVRRASGQTLEAFADEHLFWPLGITARSWVNLAGPMTYASGDLRLRPRDMAKIGYLFINDGQWDGQEVVSPEWIAAASMDYAKTRDPRWGYGYQWWIFDYPINGNVYPSFGARGWGGQVITVFPTLDMVVVLTGGNYQTSDPTDAIIQQFVLDALTG
jgi:CubicO group peptidase (beta-lactamase class C family)